MGDSGGVREGEEGLRGLREGLHRQIDEAFDEMTQPAAKGGDPFQMDFTGRETRAWTLSQEVGARLLEANLHRDPAYAAIEDSVSHTCPRCGADAPRDPDEDGDPRDAHAELKTRVGKIPLPAPLFRCPRCRKVFSPLAPAPQPGAREL